MKIASVILNVMGTVFVVAVILTVGTILGLQIAGYAPMDVLSGSMYPAFKQDQLVFINTRKKAENVKIGDVIAFDAGTDDKGRAIVITHRVVAVDAENAVFTTKGDANDIEDKPIAFSDMVGSVDWKGIPKAGYYLSNLRSKTGIALGMLGLGFLLICFGGGGVLEHYHNKRKKEAPVE
ncbi:MAG: signal peptidase I [Oscillospiraceae bacterium]|jgi:signal peptidase|nr:signal peptidase I [Oscillospiraceae bacterium]